MPVLSALELRLFERERLAVHRSHLRLGIEQVDVRRPARHVEENAPLRTRRVMRRPDGERLRCSIRILRNRCRCFGGQQIGQSEQTEAVTGTG